MGTSLSKLIVAVIVIAVIARIIKAIRRNPSRQGVIGESQVSRVLGSLPNGYLVINNVIIPNQQATSQIDHVVVSPYGIFVIETKNYKGWIFGAENSEKWKETFRTTRGNYFRNPIKQNWGHVYALADYLNLDRRVFKPIVVFSDDASLDVQSTTPVIYMSQLKPFILSYTQEIIPLRDVEILYNRISKANLVGTDWEEKHTKSVKERIARQEFDLMQGICPKCGGRLVLRNGRYGAFYGCSNYPKCKFTHNIHGS